MKEVPELSLLPWMHVSTRCLSDNSVFHNKIPSTEDWSEYQVRVTNYSNEDSIIAENELQVYEYLADHSANSAYVPWGDRVHKIASKIKRSCQECCVRRIRLNSLVKR